MLLVSAPLQLTLMLAMTEVKSVSVCVSIPHSSSFICGSPWSRADKFSKSNIHSYIPLSRDNKALLNFSTGIIN